MESPNSAREGIIKMQHKMKSTGEKWRGTKDDFYLLAHEHLFVFRKPATGENMSEFKNSVKWRQHSGVSFPPKISAAMVTLLAIRYS